MKAKTPKQNQTKIPTAIKNSLGLLLVGLVVGMLVGVVVTFYNIAANLITKYSASLYDLIRQNPWFIPLLFFVLALSAFGIGTLVHFLPMIRGSGIPQTEGASRGLINLKWYQVIPAMAASSLFCMFCGLTAGAEGPSMFLGGALGGGLNRVIGRNDMERRYQITGGACAGLAVAFNAPLSGIVFAFEEAHRRFTPSIFICAFSSVLSALATRNLMMSALNMQVSGVFSTYLLVRPGIKTYLYVALASAISGLFGVAYYKLGMLARHAFAKMTKLKGVLRMLIPFLFAGVAGLITVYTIGGGHSLIEDIGTSGGTHEMALKTVFSAPVIASLVIIIGLRLISTALNLGAGVPAGLFIPMLALGACIGALASKLCGAIGMSPVYSDLVVIISMVTFFTTVVKAPMTAIIMVVELTWQFTMLLPVILGVSIGYMLSELFRLEPLYDVLLESILSEEHISLDKHEYVVTVDAGSIAAGQPIRDILWPGNVLIHAIHRGDRLLVPSSDTVIHVGDELHIQAQTANTETLKRSVDEIVKPRRSIFYPFANALKKRNSPEQTALTEEVPIAIEETLDIGAKKASEQETPSPESQQGCDAPIENGATAEIETPNSKEEIPE